MDGVDVGEGSGVVGEADDFLYGIDGADGVGGVSGGDQLRLGIYFRGEVGHVEGAIFVVDLGPADGHSAILCHLQPRGNVGVVVEAGDDDFVSGLQLAANGAGHGVGQRGHVGAEGDFVGGAVQEVGHGAAGFGDHGVGAAAGGVGSAGVGVVAAQVVGDGVDHALRDLRPAGAVEERGGVSVDGLGEGRELGADGGEVEGGSDLLSSRHEVFLPCASSSRDSTS